MGWYVDADELFKCLCGVKHNLRKEVRVKKETVGHSDNRITEGIKDTPQAIPQLLYRTAIKKKSLCYLSNNMMIST